MILAFNTSSREFSIALLEEEGTVLAECLMSQAEGHFAALMPSLHFLLNTTRLDIHDLKCVVIAKGPGSFTGLRVGLSVAKGLCHALDIPVIGVPTLEAMASQIPYTDLPVTPIIASRKGEFFTSRFVRDNDHNLVKKMDDVALRHEDFPSLLEESTILIGNDYPNQGLPLKKMLGPRILLAPAPCWNLKASAVGALGLERFHVHDFDELEGLDPLYLRPPDIRPTPYYSLSSGSCRPEESMQEL